MYTKKKYGIPALEILPLVLKGILPHVQRTCGVLKRISSSEEKQHTCTRWHPPSDRTWTLILYACLFHTADGRRVVLLLHMEIVLHILAFSGNLFRRPTAPAQPEVPIDVQEAGEKHALFVVAVRKHSIQVVPQANLPAQENSAS